MADVNNDGAGQGQAAAALAAAAAQLQAKRHLDQGLPQAAQDPQHLLGQCQQQAQQQAQHGPHGLQPPYQDGVPPLERKAEEISTQDMLRMIMSHQAASESRMMNAIAEHASYDAPVSFHDPALGGFYGALTALSRPAVGNTTS